MNLLVIAFLIMEVVTLAWADSKIFGTWLTPFNLLSIPYAVITVLAFLFASALGFVSLYVPSVFIWEVGLFSFWAVGALLGWGFFGGIRTSRPFAASISFIPDASATKVAISAAWVCAPLMAYGLHQSLKDVGGWTGLGSYDFRVDYSHGLGAHALVLAIPLSVYLMGTWRRGEKLKLATIVILLAFLLASQVKGTLLAALIAAMIFRAACGTLRLSLGKLAAGVGVSYALFMAVYMLGISAVNPDALGDLGVYDDLSRHYLYYLWAGVLAFSQALRTGVGQIGGPWTDIFSPFINLYRSLLHAGPLIIAGSPHELGMNIDRTVGGVQGVNVYTMFGTLYFYLGPFAALLVVMGIATMVYALLMVCRFRDDSWFLTLYCCLVSWLVLAFFEYYFMYLTFIEVAAYCFILLLISSMRSKTGRVNAFVRAEA